MRNSALILVLLAFFLTSCGKKGNLYLPEEASQDSSVIKKDETKK